MQIERAVSLADVANVCRLVRRSRPVAVVAEEAGVSPATWYRLEDADVVSLPSLLRLVDYLGCAIVLRPEDVGFCGNGEPTELQEGPGAIDEIAADTVAEAIQEEVRDEEGPEEAP